VEKALNSLHATNYKRILPGPIYEPKVALSKFVETMKPTPQLKRAVALAIPVVLVLLVIHFYGAQLGAVGFAADHCLQGIAIIF
jgi:hypothetical protein